VARGSPEAIAAVTTSHTGRYLREVLERARPSLPRRASAR
jgi:hypothetical protein